MKSNRLEWQFVEQNLMTETKNRSREELKGYAEGLMDAIYIAPTWQACEWALRRLVLMAKLDISMFNNYWDTGYITKIMCYVGVAYVALTGEQLVAYLPFMEGFSKEMIDPRVSLKTWVREFDW